MKKITFIVALLVGLNVYSQDVLWSTDCEDYATADYNVIDLDQDGLGFGVIDYGDVGGPTDFKFFSESWNSTLGALTPDNWLFSPEMTFPAGTESVTLSVDVFAQDTDWPAENFSIGLYDLVADSGTNFHTETLTSAANVNDPKTVAVTINSTDTDFSGQTLRMYVRHHDCSDNYRFIVDNISVTTTSSLSKPDLTISDLKLYPNPTDGLITISNAVLSDIKNISVTNQLGQMVKDINPLKLNNNTFDISDLNKGIYFVQIRDISNNSKTLRVVKN